MIELTGAVFEKYVNSAMNAVELIPEDERNFVLWTQQFPNPEGGADIEVKAMTPEELALDMYGAMTVFSRVASGEVEISPELFQGVRAEREALKPKSMKEIAAAGREKGKKAAAYIDNMKDIDLEKEIPSPRGGMMTAREWSSVEFAHLIHHRGQLFWCLRAIGIKPPQFI